MMLTRAGQKGTAGVDKTVPGTVDQMLAVGDAS